MERLQIERQRSLSGGGSIETAKPFHTGETLSRVYPHLGPNGQKHKGNMKVAETDGTFSDSGNVGQAGKAICVLPGCGVTVEIVAKSFE